MPLCHDVAGRGSAVALLHSSVCDRRMWDPQWPALIDAGYRVVRADFRGFGETPVADRPYDEAEDVVELLDALDIERAALVGSSYGGRIALEIAARWPERVTALVLLCAGAPGQEPTDELRAYARREQELVEAGDIAAAVELNIDTWLGPEADGTVREGVRRMQRASFEVQLAAAEEISPTRVETSLSAVRARCLAVSGGHDLPDFRQIAARLPEVLPDARHVELAWAGHLPNLERPAEVTRLMLAFLSGSDPVGIGGSGE